MYAFFFSLVNPVMAGCGVLHSVRHTESYKDFLGANGQVARWMRPGNKHPGIDSAIPPPHS